MVRKDEDSTDQDKRRADKHRQRERRTVYRTEQAGAWQCSQEEGEG